MKYEVPKPRTYLGYTIRAYPVRFLWEVNGEFDPETHSGTAQVGVAAIPTLEDARRKVREFESEFGRAGRGKPSPSRPSEEP